MQLVAVSPPKKMTMAKDIMGSNSLWAAFQFFCKTPSCFADNPASCRRCVTNLLGTVCTS